MKEFFSGAPYGGAFLRHFRQGTCRHALLPWREDRCLSQKAPACSRAGDAVDEVGLVLAGSTLIVQEDIWGNRNILSKSGPGQTFAEVFACAPGAVLNVSVEAESAVTVMFLHIKRVLSMCPSACSHHNRIIRNLLSELAEKNLRLNEKLTHMGQRTTRAKAAVLFFPQSRSAGTAMSSTFRSLVSSLRIISAWSAADCLWNLAKCGMRACLTFIKSHFVFEGVTVFIQTGASNGKVYIV